MASRIGYSQTAPVAWHGWYRSQQAIGGTIALVTGDLTAGNTVALMRVPKGFVLTGFRSDVSDMDTNGTPTLTFTIGDSGSANRLVASSNLGQTGGQITGPVQGALGYRFPADTDILWTTGTGAATAAAGTVTAFAFGYIDN